MHEYHAFVAVKVDVDDTTLRPFRQFLYPGPPCATKLGPGLLKSEIGGAPEPSAQSLTNLWFLMISGVLMGWGVMWALAAFIEALQIIFGVDAGVI